MSSPLRIGILGAARIAKEGIVEPARVLGHELVAVAARDRGRAEAFAEEHGVRAVHETYAEVIADPQVDVVYNALVNSFHAEWNVAALEAGKNVLSEKPLTSNAEQARNLRDVAREATGTIVEGFHYIHHPVNQRLGELVTSGALGQVRQVELVLAIPTPPETDPRWSLDLAGGATMDLGCYVLDAARHVGEWLGSAPQITSVEATLRAAQMDAAMRVELGYAHGVPHLDNRLLVTRNGITSQEILGDQTSYTYQLARFADALGADAPFPSGIDGSVANAELIDECYRRAGLTPRGA